MLPPDCHWIETATGVSLRRRYGCAAFIVREAQGVRVVIQRGKRPIYSRAASVEQGMRWVTRWVAARTYSGAQWMFPSVNQPGLTERRRPRC